jgi:HK97 family phage prohead protease
MNIKRITFKGEIKAVDNGPEGTFEGHGSVFGNVDSYGDVVMAGAFADTLKENGLPALLWQHRMDEPIGVYDECREDDRGLYVKGRILLDVQKGKEAHALLKAGALKGLSIGYSTEDYAMDEVQRVRRLKKVRLWEVSLVTFPANTEATVGAVKYRPERPSTIREFEAHLRDAGFSKEDALRLASVAKSQLPQMWDASAEGKMDMAILEAMAALQKLQNTLPATPQR